LQSRYGDTTDVCYVDRQPLIETESRFSESMIAGGIGGAALGAGLGALLSGGSGRGAAWGALAGGLSGLVGGYLYAKQQQAQTREQLLASIDADAGRDYHHIVQTNSALDRLVACRQMQMNQVAAQYRSRAITPLQAKAEFEQIAARMANDDALISEVVGKSNERASTYVSARAKVLGIEETTPPQAVSAQASSQAPQTETAVFARATQEAAAKEREHQRLRADLQTRINELGAAVG
jgi:outer membrane lipoprotein SlyB